MIIERFAAVAALGFVIAAAVADPCVGQPTVTAPSGVAVGGNIENSPISIINKTVNQENPATLALLAKALSDKDASEERRHQAEAKTAELAQKLGFTTSAVAEFFHILGEKSVPEEKIPVRLTEIATHFAQTRDELAALDSDDPHTAELARAAKTALDAGRLSEADNALDQAKEAELAAMRQARELRAKAQAAEDRHALNAAKLLAGRGNIALTQLRYADAAQQFKDAADLVPPGHPSKTAGYLQGEAYSLYREADERGDNAALKQSIETWGLVLKHRKREQAPLDWAMTKNDLGNALELLGERESGPWHLEEAIAAYRAALEERTRERAPLDWAETQNNLGDALEALGEREEGTRRLREAILAYRAALEERTRERVPFAWAETENNLGSALESLGERESGTAHLEEAISVYRGALEEWTRDRMPLRWAEIQNNLGSALEALGEREGGTERLEEAVSAYRAALEERTRERVPLDWAETQTNLGMTLAAVGERESGTAHLAEALSAYRAALEEYTRERVPLDWAETQNNLGNALKVLGERESGTARLEEAAAAFDASLTVLTTAWPEEWVEEVRSNRDETRAEITRRQAAK
jgi:tetratricopeptide (TPR) repeat protein